MFFFSETHRQQLAQIPSLQQLLSTAGGSLNEQQYRENQLLSKDYDDPLAQHLFRYSEFVSNDLEAKPINEKMDHWYLDLKKNLMVTKCNNFLLFISFSSFRLDWIRQITFTISRRSSTNNSPWKASVRSLSSHFFSTSSRFSRSLSLSLVKPKNTFVWIKTSKPCVRC